MLIHYTPRLWVYWVLGHTELPIRHTKDRLEKNNEIGQVLDWWIRCVSMWMSLAYEVSTLWLMRHKQMMEFWCSHYKAVSELFTILILDFYFRKFHREEEIP